MIDKQIRDKIEARAWEIYQWRKENNISGCALGDWLDAQSEIITDRRIEGCPKCGYKLLVRNNGEIACLSNTCKWKIKSQRKSDKDISDVKEIKTIWE